MIDEDCALFHAGEGAIGSDRNRAQIIVVADAAHHEILAFGRGFWRRRGAPAELVRPFLRLGAGPVVHGHLMATFFHQMSCHGETHYAETEKSDFSHVCYLEVLPALGWPDGVLEGAAPYPLRRGGQRLHLAGGAGFVLG